MRAPFGWLAWFATLAFIARSDAARAQSQEAGSVLPEAKAAAGGAPAMPRRRWSLVLSAGVVWGGNPEDLEASMHAARLDQSFDFGGIGVPSLITIPGGGANEVSVTLGYAIRSWLDIRVQGRQGGEIDWESSGYHGPYEDTMAGVFFSTEAKLRPVAAALASVLAGPLRVGVGPSITRLQVQAWSLPAESFAPTTESRVGLVLELGASLPLGRRFLADLSWQRHWVGSEEIGPYPLHDLSGQLSTTYPATRVSFDHTSFKVGLGVRW